MILKLRELDLNVDEVLRKFDGFISIFGKNRIRGKLLGGFLVVSLWFGMLVVESKSRFEGKIFFKLSIGFFKDVIGFLFNNWIDLIEDVLVIFILCLCILFNYEFFFFVSVIDMFNFYDL